MSQNIDILLFNGINLKTITMVIVTITSAKLFAYENISSGFNGNFAGNIEEMFSSIPYT